MTAVTPMCDNVHRLTGMPLSRFALAECSTALSLSSLHEKLIKYLS